VNMAGVIAGLQATCMFDKLSRAAQQVLGAGPRTTRNSDSVTHTALRLERCGRLPDILIALHRRLHKPTTQGRCSHSSYMYQQAGSLQMVLQARQVG
jgi:hypothetical protein